MSANPYLQFDGPGINRCILCDLLIDDKDKKAIQSIAFDTIQKNARLWSKIDKRVCIEQPYKAFREASLRLPQCFTETLYTHKGCAVSFRSRLKTKQLQSAKLEENDALCDDQESRKSYSDDESLVSTSRKKRTKLLREKRTEKSCLICNERSSDDALPYNDGGLARCSEEKAALKLKTLVTKKMLDEQDRHYEAAKRIDILLNGASYDVFAADVYYHKKCYASFSYSYDKKETLAYNAEQERKVMGYFDEMIRRRVIQDKESFLMTELLKDFAEISSDFGLSEPPIRQTKYLKTHIEQTFPDEIAFSKVGQKKQVLHSNTVGPVTYVEAALKGHGLREFDLTKAFARLVRRKLANRHPLTWPPTTEELCESLETFFPLECIFNAIALSLNDKWPINENGIVSVPKDLNHKISSLAQGWEALTLHGRSPLNIAMGLTVNRLTGSKETSRLLHCGGIGISYNDVRLLSNSWAEAVTMEHAQMLPPGFVKGRAVHITFDNSDGRQQTLTGSQTTHHTTGTIFQPSFPGDKGTRLYEPCVDLLHHGKKDFGSYVIPKKREDPPAMPDFEDKFKDSPLIEEAFYRDVAWVVCGAVSKEMLLEIQPELDTDALQPVGSWTNFMKAVTDCTTRRCKLEYLPVIPLPPHDNVVKWYMDMIQKMLDQLEIDHIFLHADQAIHSKVLIIQWLNQGKYDQIITFLGGFHTIMVNLKILEKKYSCLGLKEWWIEADVIAQGSADQAMEGRHYHRSIRLHKQAFEALLRYRMKGVLNKGVFTPGFKRQIVNLRLVQSTANLNSITNSPEFNR